MASRLAVLKRQRDQGGVPVVYINDNFGQCAFGLPRTVAHCTAPPLRDAGSRSACADRARLLRV